MDLVYLVIVPLMYLTNGFWKQVRQKSLEDVGVVFFCCLFFICLLVLFWGFLRGEVVCCFFYSRINVLSSIF